MDKLITQRILKPWLMGKSGAPATQKSLGLTLTMEMRDMGIFQDMSELPEMVVRLMEEEDGRRKIVIRQVNGRGGEYP